MSPRWPPPRTEEIDAAFSRYCLPAGPPERSRTLEGHERVTCRGKSRAGGASCELAVDLAQRGGWRFLLRVRGAIGSSGGRSTVR